MSFIRRFSSFPSTQTISQIEGVVIVDALPPSPLAGVSTGVVGAIGEFADMTYAVNVSGVGAVTTKPQSVEVTSAQDMASFFGGFDATIGDFGGDAGWQAVQPSCHLPCEPCIVQGRSRVAFASDEQRQRTV